MNVDDLLKNISNHIEKTIEQYIDNDKSEHLYLFALNFKTFTDNFLRVKEAKFKNLFSNGENDKKIENIIEGVSLLDKEENNQFILSSYSKDALEWLEKYKEKELYISLLQVIYPSLDQQENIIAPLFYLKTKIVKDDKDQFGIKLVDKEPHFNSALIYHLKKTYDIDISYEGYLFDIEEIYDLFSSKNSNFIRLEKAIVLSSLSLNDDFPYFNIALHQGMLENFSINHFFVKQNKQVNSENKYIYSNDAVLNKLYLSLKYSNCTILNVENSSLKEYAAEKIIFESLLNKKSVSVFTKNTDLMDKIRKKYDIDKLIFSPNGKDNYLAIDKEDWKTDKKNKNIFSIYGKYFDLQEQKNSSFSLPLGDNINENIDLLASYSDLPKVRFDIELDEYEKEDYFNDKKFFKTLDGLTSLKNIPLSQHPFYGLTSRSDENTYNNFVELINKTLNDISIFKDKIDELDYQKLNSEPVESLLDYQRLEKHFLILKQYDEAYLPYLKMDTDNYHQDELIEIINKFNMLSSSKTTIDLYAEPEFWGLDIKQIIADYNDKGKVKRKAIDILLDYEKTPDRKNINYFVRLINIYFKNQDELLALQKNLLNEGIDVSTIDKAKEAYNAFEYRRALDTHVYLYDDIDFKNNRFFKEFFDDKKTRDYLNEKVFPILEESSRNLESDFDNLKILFDAGEQRDYEVMTFVEVEKVLNVYKTIDYKIYNDYFTFSKICNEISLPLKEVINELIEDNKSFENLEFDYFSSLIFSYKKIVLAETKNIEEQMRRFKPLWRNALKTNNDNLNINLVNTARQNIFKSFEDDDIKKIYIKIKKLYNSYDNLRNQKMISVFQEYVKQIYPLVLIEQFDDYNTLFSTDLTIIDNIDSIAESDLLNILLVSKKIIVFTDKSKEAISVNEDRLILNDFFPEVQYYLSTILDEVDYSVFDQEFLSIINKNAKSMGLLILKDYVYSKDKYPLAIVRPGEEKPLYLILPENGIKNKTKFVPSFFPVINNIYGVVPLEVSPILLALLTKDMLTFMVEPVKAISDYYQPSFKNPLFTDKQEYLKKLQEIKDSFTEKIKLENLQDAKNETILSALPITVEEKENYLLTIKITFDILLEQGKIYEEDEWFYPTDNHYISLHKGEKNNFNFKELISGIMQYLLSFSYLYKDTLKDEIAGVLEIDPDDEEYSDSFENAIIYLYQNKKICISETDQISVYKMLESKHN